MEHQQEDEDGPATSVTKTASSIPPVTMKRSPRMLHESSFATSSFATGRGHQLKRPPGFIVSSLDYQASVLSSPNYTVDGASIDKNRPLTTNPVPDKILIKERQEREQAERDRQYQQQRSYQNGNPTRAQGHFGPPPHTIKTFEDLEHMTEDQIYKLFFDDPELHASLMKTAAKGNRDSKTSPSSVPVGARKARSSKSYSTGKSSRSSSKRSQMLEQVEKEVPYFQWLVILVIIIAAIRQLIKACASPVTTAKNSVTPYGKKVKGGKQKNRKGTKTTTKIPKKSIQSKRRSFSPVKKEEVVVAVAGPTAVDTTTTTINDTTINNTATVSSSSKRSSSNRKKKAKSKQKPVAVDEESSVEKKYVAIAVAVSDPIAPVKKKEIDVAVAVAVTDPIVPVKKKEIDVAVAVADPIVVDTTTTNNDTTTVSSSSKRSSTSRKKKVKSKHEKELKPTVVKTDKRNKDRHETDKTLVMIENELVSSTSFPTSDGLGEDEWQTVAKSKGDKKGKTVTPVNLGKNNSDSLGGKLDDNVSNTEETKEKRVEKADVNYDAVKEPLADCTAHEKASKKLQNKPKNNTNKKTNTTKSSNEEKENTYGAQKTVNNTNGGATTIVKEDKKTSEDESLKNSITDIEDEEQPTITGPTPLVEEKSTDDDAAFALLLHKEEVNLARATSTENHDNQEEEVWEEVPTKKKKGISV